MPTIPIYFQRDLPPTTPNPSSTTLPIRNHKFPTPTLRLHLNDLSHEGSSIFLSSFHGNEDFETQVQNVLNLLYTPSCKRPGTRSVTLVLRQMNGVAYTTGTELDEDHKEIHFSLNYITSAAKSKPSVRDEILGVVCHELVHCFQYSAEGTCPGGLIEGVADWVRLRAGLAAKHWRQEADGKWDAGYQHTGYFLEYLEQRFGPGTVRRMNGCLREGKWDEGRVFKECCEGKKVEGLWEEYREELKRKKEREGKKEGKQEEIETPPEPIPTHDPSREWGGPDT